MKLVSIKFLNFRKFRQETLELTGSFNTIFGLNGSGKTSITDAIGYALFGSRGNDFTRVSAKGDLVSYFVRDIDGNSDYPSKIELILEINGETYKIVRVINPGLKKNRSDFIIELQDSLFGPNLDPIIGPGEVTTYIEKNLLGVDREIFLRSVFAKQKDLLVLSGNARDRKKIINSILGIDMIEELVISVGDDARDKKRELKIKKGDLSNFSLEEVENSKKELEIGKNVEEKKQKESEKTIKKMSSEFEKIKSDFQVLQAKKDLVVKTSNTISLIKQKQEKAKIDREENISKLANLSVKEAYVLKNAGIFDTEKKLLQDFSEAQKQEILFTRKTALEKEINIVSDKLKSIEEEIKTSELDFNKTSPLTPLLSGENSFYNNSIEQPHPNPLLRGEGIVGMRENYKNVPEYIVELSKNLRKYGTESEEILWEILRDRRFEGLKFRRQYAFGRYIADFYCHEILLVIELDGKIHENQKEYDEIRDEIIKTYGVKILRIKNEEIYSDLTNLYNKIIQLTPSPLRRGSGGGLFGEETSGGLFGESFQIIESSFDSKLKTLQEELNNLSQKLGNLTSDLSKLKDEAEEIKKEKENIVSLGENADCPTCKRKLESQYSFLINSFEKLLEEKRNKWKFISEEKQKTDNSLSAKKEEISSLENEILKFKQDKEKFTKLQSEQDKLEENLAKLTEEFTSFKDVNFDINSFIKLQNELSKISKQSNELKRLEGEIKLIPEIKTKLENLEIEEKNLENQALEEQRNLEKIDFKEDVYNSMKKSYDEFYLGFNKAQQELTEINKLIFDFDKKIQVFVNQIDEYNKTLKSVESLIEDLAYLEVKKQVLKDYSSYLFSYLKPRLEDIASEYFATMTDFKYSRIEIDSEYNIKIDSRILDLYSGGEQDLANLCLRLALGQNIGLTNTKNHINFLVLDEVLGSQDSTRQNNILIGLKKLEHKFSQILLISHLESVKDFSTKLIEVKALDKDESEIIEY